MTFALLPAAAAARADSGFLLAGTADIDAARRKAERYAWARAALERLIAAAEKDLASPLNVPERGGQWTHWYSCKKDGAQLKTVSATEHRCPVCGTVYSGDPYDAVVITRAHSNNSRAARDLGLAFRLTGRKEFARRAGEILVAYAERYRKYPRHNIRGEDKVGGGRLLAQTLDESVWLIPVAWGYALVRETLPEKERLRIESDLLLAAAEVIREHRMGIHNIQCWKNSAVGLAGFATTNDALVKEAIDDPERGWRAQIAKGVTDDGLWYEGSIGYHQYTMQALWPLAEAARISGMNLYDERYRTLYDAPLALALPNGDPPGFNDSAGGNITGAAPLYELAFARWKRAEYGRVAGRADRGSVHALLYGEGEVPEGPLVPERSALLKSAGFAMLRSRGASVAMRFGRHGGGHGHPDKLNIVTWGAGRLFGLDPGSINYGVPLHQEWYRSTIAHNTVSVDGQLQSNADGALEDWREEGGSTTIVASANGAYPGVALRRTVTLRRSEISDRFECISDSEHVYDWAFHAAGRLTTSLELTTRAGFPGGASGYQHIIDISEGRADAEFWARWETDGARLTIRFRGAPATEVFTGSAPGRDPAADRVPLLIVRRRAARSVFEAAHRFETG